MKTDRSGIPWLIVLLAAACSSSSGPTGAGGTVPGDPNGGIDVDPDSLALDPGGTCAASVRTRLAWTYRDPVGAVAPPAVRNGELLVASSHGYRRLEAATGQVLLDVPVGLDLLGFAVSGDTVALRFVDDVRALRAVDGAPLWVTPVDSPVGSEIRGRNTLVAGPDGLLYVPTFGPMVALDVQSGRQQTATGDGLAIDPPGFDDAGNALVMVREDGIVVRALAAGTGNTLWTSPSYDRGPSGTPPGYPPPVAVGRHVVFFLLLLGTPTVVVLDAATGQEVGRGAVPGALILDLQPGPDQTALVATDATVAAVHIPDGALLWRTEPLFNGRVAFIGETVYVSGDSFEGRPTAKALVPATGTALWTFSPPADLLLASVEYDPRVAAIDANKVALPAADCLFALSTATDAIDTATLACEPCQVRCLDGKWRGRCAPDGRAWRRLEACGDACQGDSCVTCSPRAGKGCHDGDVYWLDSCGRPHERIEDCGDATCRSATCVKPHTSCDCSCQCFSCRSTTQKTCTPASTECGSCAVVCQAVCSQSGCGGVSSATGTCR